MALTLLTFTITEGEGRAGAPAAGHQDPHGAQRAPSQRLHPSHPPSRRAGHPPAPNSKIVEPLVKVAKRRKNYAALSSVW